MRFRKENFGFITDIRTIYNNKKDRAYKIWMAMINRCYNKKDRGYRWYGAKGVCVCDEWKLFSNFKKWYDENNPTGELQMDKDISGLNEYSPAGCVFISKSDNIREANSRRDYSYLRFQTGNRNKNSKPKEHYEKNAVRRHDFIKACRRQGWNFEDFLEIKSEEKYKGRTKFYYKERV